MFHHSIRKCAYFFIVFKQFIYVIFACFVVTKFAFFAKYAKQYKHQEFQITKFSTWRNARKWLQNKLCSSCEDQYVFCKCVQSVELPWHAVCCADVLENSGLRIEITGTMPWRTGVLSQATFACFTNILPMSTNIVYETSSLAKAYNFVVRHLQTATVSTIYASHLDIPQTSIAYLSF